MRMVLPSGEPGTASVWAQMGLTILEKKKLISSTQGTRNVLTLNAPLQTAVADLLTFYLENRHQSGCSFVGCFVFLCNLDCITSEGKGIPNSETPKRQCASVLVYCAYSQSPWVSVDCTNSGCSAGKESMPCLVCRRTWVWFQNPLTNVRQTCYLSPEEGGTGVFLGLIRQAIWPN